MIQDIGKNRSTKSTMVNSRAIHNFMYEVEARLLNLCWDGSVGKNISSKISGLAYYKSSKKSNYTKTK